MSTPPKHVVLGAGPVGRATAAELCARGLEPVLVDRGAVESPLPGVHHLVGDVLDDAFLGDAIGEGDVVYQTLGLPYHRWERDWPPLQEAVVRRCLAANARLVSFENLYAYGQGELAEDAPLAPASKKGELRAQLIGALERARGEGLDVVHVRASDLFGPGVTQSALGAEFFGRLKQGLTPRGLGDPDAPHTWTYVGDAARTLAEVGLHAEPPRVVHVPSAPACSFRELSAALSLELGRTVPLATTPTPVLRLVGLFDPVVREVPEQLYAFEAPFVMGDSVARETLGLRETYLPAAIRRTLGDTPAAPPAPRGIPAATVALGVEALLLGLATLLLVLNWVPFAAAPRAAWLSIHISAAVLLLGNISVVALLLGLADASGHPDVRRFVSGFVNIADAVFTGPGSIALLLSGASLMQPWGALGSPWIQLGFGLFLGGGALWLAVLVPLQVRLQRQAEAGDWSGWERTSRLYMAPGIVTVGVMFAVLFVMIAK